LIIKLLPGTKFSKGKDNKVAIVLDYKVLIARVLQAKLSSVGQISSLANLENTQNIPEYNSGENPFKLNFDELHLETG